MQSFRNSTKLLKRFIGIKTHKRCINILGIETSCDDTGIAIVNEKKQVLGESLYSQQNLHLKYGGIIPPRAQALHRENIDKAVTQCFENSGIDFHQIDAIAVTNRPGLPLSLTIGIRYAKYLARKHNKPVIPIHHMEAHALAARLNNEIKLPYLCLLISGGHSQLVLVKSVSEFYLLGESLDDAPGEAFDKISRRLRLALIPGYNHLNGGQAIEKAASKSQFPNRYEFPLPLCRYRDCNFSFAGLKNNALRTIRSEEKTFGIRPDEVIIHYEDFCAGLLRAVTRHLSHRTQRAIEFCEKQNLMGTSDRSLVISGGVACNDFIFEHMGNLGKELKFNTYRPIKKYCSDNGVMIAWNGIEKILDNNETPSWITVENLDHIKPIGKCSLGKNLIDFVAKEQIRCKWIQIKNRI